MRFLIGVDDTDNLQSRGTGFRARDMARTIEDAGLGTANGITRHQLLVDPRIPFTSHNSSACISLEVAEDGVGDLVAHCRRYLLSESAEGSDAGLCVAPWPASPEVQGFGRRAQAEVLREGEARDLAVSQGIVLEGLTGNGGGVIGALAAIGLRSSGNDGRFLWLRGLRELAGVRSVAELRAEAGIEEVRTLDGQSAMDSDLVDVGSWVRPILKGGKSVLLVEVEKRDDRTVDWRVVPKEIVKRY